jgi:hypothetical protein
MNGKNCKSKIKVSKYGKKKGGGDEGLEYLYGSYNFENKDICCFSDLEGNMPKEIKELMFNLQASNDIDYEPKNLTEIKRAIVFTGDLIDRGAYSIRNLLNMYNLKNVNYQDVILICGNRDLNKIRMYHECCIPYIEDTIFIPENNSKPIAEIVNLLKEMPDNCYPFKYQARQIAKNINITGVTLILDKFKNQLDKINRQNIDDNFIESYRNDIFRIDDMYVNTLGSPNQIKFFSDEYKVLFGENLFNFIDDDFIDDMIKDEVKKEDRYKLLLKFIAMMNMVMGKEWDEGVLPIVLQRYNGLYIKYLTNCHIIAEFTKDNKYFLASHSGIPYDKANNLFYIPEKIGSKYNPNNLTNTELIIQLNTEFKKFIANIDYQKKEYRKYVAMAAACGDINIGDGDDTKYTSEASPVVSSLLKEEYDKRDIGLNSLIKEGTRNITKIYNIYGHLPTGLLPTVSKIVDNRLTSYHIGLDISKAENGKGISNKTSYVYFRINNIEGKVQDSFVGKTVYNLPYQTVNIDETSLSVDNPQKLQDIALETAPITITYNQITRLLIDTYSDTKIKAEHKSKPLTLFSVDGRTYYGISGWMIVKYTKFPSSTKAIPDKPTQGGGKAIKKTYAKSAKRFMNGKKQMVIYLGKRGGEYLKIKGEYMSLVKYIKIANKKKPTKKKG